MAGKKSSKKKKHQFKVVDAKTGDYKPAESGKIDADNFMFGLFQESPAFAESVSGRDVTARQSLAVDKVKKSRRGKGRK